MRKLFVFLLFVSVPLLNYGCGTVTVQKPKIPDIPVVQFEEPKASTSMFLPPVPKNYTFVEKNGKDTKTEDNVSVRVASIVNKIDADIFSTTIEGPDGRQYKYSIFPMMLVLEITNNTYHIITLRRTIIHLEDENQREYPLVSTLDDNKRRLADEIGKAFDEYTKQTVSSVDTQKITNEYKSRYRSIVYGDYKADYDRMVREIKEAESNPMKEGVRTPDMVGGHLTAYGIEELLKEYSPDTVYSEGERDLNNNLRNITYQYNAKNQQKLAEINMLKNKAIQQIINLPKINDVITEGEYLPINILPGRTKKIIAPFSRRTHDTEIQSILVGIYDLPTKVNEAGDPIKRTNFNFHMIAERI